MAKATIINPDLNLKGIPMPGSKFLKTRNYFRKFGMIFAKNPGDFYSKTLVRSLIAGVDTDKGPSATRQLDIVKELATRQDLDDHLILRILEGKNITNVQAEAMLVKNIKEDANVILALTQNLIKDRDNKANAALGLEGNKLMVVLNSGTAKIEFLEDEREAVVGRVKDCQPVIEKRLGTALKFILDKKANYYVAEKKQLLKAVLEDNLPLLAAEQKTIKEFGNVPTHEFQSLVKMHEKNMVRTAAAIAKTGIYTEGSNKDLSYEPTSIFARFSALAAKESLDTRVGIAEEMANAYIIPMLFPKTDDKGTLDIYEALVTGYRGSKLSVVEKMYIADMMIQAGALGHIADAVTNYQGMEDVLWYKLAAGAITIRAAPDLRYAAMALDIIQLATIRISQTYGTAVSTNEFFKLFKIIQDQSARLAGKEESG
ncbi:MAG: hypothetical protein WC506_01650 [Candidatus Micrarchaeia archaeon]